MSDINSPVKLYITLTSPYARLARIVVIEKELDDKVEQIIAKTRQVDSPYYQACVDFCAKWDQTSFDPDFKAKPLEYFVPLIHRLFARTPGSHV